MASSPQEFLNTEVEVLPIQDLPDDEICCSICYKEYENPKTTDYDTTNETQPTPELPVRIRGCGHIFGQACLTAHINGIFRYSRECPMCRVTLYTSTVPYTSLFDTFVPHAPTFLTLPIIPTPIFPTPAVDPQREFNQRFAALLTSLITHVRQHQAIHNLLGQAEQLDNDAVQPFMQDFAMVLVALRSAIGILTTWHADISRIATSLADNVQALRDEIGGATGPFWVELLTSHADFCLQELGAYGARLVEMSDRVSRLEPQADGSIPVVQAPRRRSM
jgi:hypothetical protein